MKTKFRYSLDKDGNILGCGYCDIFENELDGTEPFTGFDIEYYKKDMETGEWIYLPDVTPINTEITKVEYDWENNKVHITLKDQFRPGPYQFDCTDNWSIEDCQNAIDAKFQK